MKHIKQLAYNVVQFRYKEYILISSLFSGVGFAITLWWPCIPCAFAGVFIADMIDEQKKYNSNGKKY